MITSNFIFVPELFVKSFLITELTFFFLFVKFTLQERFSVKHVILLR